MPQDPQKKDVEMVMLRCLECGQEIAVEANGVEMRYGLTVFCHDKDCEDRYSFKQ